MTGIIAVLVAGAAVDAGEQVPAATVTLLLVGIERLTQPAESGPEAMMAAMARPEVVAGETITRHRVADGRALAADPAGVGGLVARAADRA